MGFRYLLFETYVLLENLIFSGFFFISENESG